jgi:hypothetical protein
LADWTAVVDKESRRLFQIQRVLGFMDLDEYDRQSLLELADNLERKLKTRSDNCSGGLSAAGVGFFPVISPRRTIEPLRRPVMISREVLTACESQAGR